MKDLPICSIRNVNKFYQNQNSTSKIEIGQSYLQILIQKFQIKFTKYTSDASSSITRSNFSGFKLNMVFY